MGGSEMTDQKNEDALLKERIAKIEKIRDKILTKEENQIIELKLSDMTDKQVAAVLNMSVPTVNQKKLRLYRLVKSLAWYIDNRKHLINHIEKDPALSMEAPRILDLIAMRYTKEAIIEEFEKRDEKISDWKVSKITKNILIKFEAIEEFKTFFESLKLGYVLPWNKKDTKDTNGESKEDNNSSYTETEDGKDFPLDLNDNENE